MGNQGGRQGAQCRYGTAGQGRCRRNAQRAYAGYCGDTHQRRAEGGIPYVRCCNGNGYLPNTGPGPATWMECPECKGAGRRLDTPPLIVGVARHALGSGR